MLESADRATKSSLTNNKTAQVTIEREPDSSPKADFISPSALSFDFVIILPMP